MKHDNIYINVRKKLLNNTKFEFKIKKLGKINNEN